MHPPNLSSTGQSIAWYARHTPGAAAIVEDDRTVTWWMLARDLVRCVRAPRTSAVGPGMLAGLQMSRRYTHLLLMLACEIVGAAATSLSLDDASNDADIIQHCDAVFTETEAAAAGSRKTFVLPPDWLSRLVHRPVSSGDLSLLEREIPPEQIARIVRTSGTTGRPKAMPMTHATQQLRVTRTIDRVADDILPNPRFLCLYGLSVGSVYVRVLGVLQNGGTVFFTVGEHVPRLIADGTVNYATFSLGDMEATVRRALPPLPGHKMHVEVFGATVAAALRQQIRERLNAHITNKYSSNETNPIAIIDDDNVGTLCPGVEVRIVGEDGGEVAAGEAGRIRVKTETMVHGYFNDPSLTDACFIDGWYQTSDLGRMLAPDKLVLLGRADDVLNIGGVKISPSPIEARLKAIDGISDAVLLSFANENDVGVLLVALETSGKALAPEAAGRVDAVLEPYHTRFRVVEVNVFPRTQTGKIKRHEIETTYRALTP